MSEDQICPAMKRATEMMSIPMNQLPKLAISYARELCYEVGMCGEVMLTAYAHYAQKAEGLACDDDLYKFKPLEDEHRWERAVRRVDQ